MYNNKEKISANEINKYTFCNYQWYYERLYGSKNIRNEYKKRNESLNLISYTKIKLNKGVKFHNRYLLKRKILSILKSMFIIILIVLCSFIFLKL